MERRKFIIGAGSLAAGSAAAMGTGAFTSVEADRTMTVNLAKDSNALLALSAEDSQNGKAYVHEHDGVLSIEVGDGSHWEKVGYSSSDGGGSGVNKNAQTIIRNLFQVTNQGTQNVYVWAEGLPEGINMFHDDSSDPENSGTGAGKNQGAFSGTSNIDPENPSDEGEPENPGGNEAAPLLKPGQTLDNVGMYVKKSYDFSSGMDADITIHAVAEDEV